MNAIRSRLRFVQADQLDTSAGRLNDVLILSPRRKPLGMLAGVMVDPMDHCICYYVIRSRGWLSSRHYLAPRTAQARLSGDAHRLEVDFDADELRAFEQVDPRVLVRFTEDDLLATMFQTHAA